MGQLDVAGIQTNWRQMAAKEKTALKICPKFANLLGHE